MLPKMLLKIAFQSWTHAQNAAKSPVESQASEQEFEQKWDHHVRIGNRRGMKRPKNGSNEPTVRSSFIAEVASCCYSRSLFREFQSETSESWPRFSIDQTPRTCIPTSSWRPLSGLPTWVLWILPWMRPWCSMAPPPNSYRRSWETVFEPPNKRHGPRCAPFFPLKQGAE